jgi:thiol:disulfide interchange protein
MERTDDFRLNKTPTALLAIAAVLLVLRLGLTIYEWQHPLNRGRHLAWTDAASYKPDQHDSKKLRLYEFYAAWCAPCQRMENEVMTNEEIRNCVDKNFVALRVTDRQREDGKNTPVTAELLKKYRIFAFPTLVAVGADGEPIQLLVGNSSSLAVYRFLTRVLNDVRTSGTGRGGP